MYERLKYRHNNVYTDEHCEIKLTYIYMYSYLYVTSLTCLLYNVTLCPLLQRTSLKVRSQPVLFIAIAFINSLPQYHMAQTYHCKKKTKVKIK